MRLSPWEADCATERADAAGEIPEQTTTLLERERSRGRRWVPKTLLRAEKSGLESRAVRDEILIVERVSAREKVEQSERERDTHLYERGFVRLGGVGI